MASIDYVYTQSKMRFADPQFAEWETNDRKLKILNFKNITIIGTNNIVYIFKHLVEENNRHRTLVLAWQGSNDDIWLSLINQAIKICFEDPDHPNAFIIYDAYRLLMLLHNGSEIMYYKSSVANFRHLKYIQHIHSNILIAIYRGDNYTTVWWREIRIRPWNKHGILIKDAPGTQITTIMRESKHIINTSCYTKYLYSHNTNEIICHCHKNGATYIPIYRININTLEYSTPKINIESNSIINSIDPESGLVLFRDARDHIYIKDPDTKIRKNVIGASNYTYSINSTTFIQSFLGKLKYDIMYYDKGTQKLTKLFDTYHKVYSAGTNTMIAGLTVYKRVPKKVIDILPSIVPNCPPHCCELIGKFLKAITNTIIPEQELEQS